jgi:hypothetical protein
MCGWIVTQVDLTVVLEGFCDPFPSFFHNVDVGAALKCEVLIAKISKLPHENKILKFK